MGVKFNEATNNRPDGDRVIDAPFLFIDIEKYERQLKEEEAWGKNDRNGITVFKNEAQTIVLTALHAGAAVDDNLVNGNITLHLLSGLAGVNIGGEIVTLRHGQIITLQPGINHSITAMDDCLFLITTLLHK